MAFGEGHSSWVMRVQFDPWSCGEATSSAGPPGELACLCAGTPGIVCACVLVGRLLVTHRHWWSKDVGTIDHTWVASTWCTRESLASSSIRGANVVVQG